MYVVEADSQLSGLGFSLKLPKWVPSIIRNPINKLIDNTKVNVPTPAGTVPVPLNTVTQSVGKTGVTVGAGPQPSGPMTLASNLPGGSKTLLIAGGLLALGAVALMSKKRSRRR